jgi:hypothetical protein
MPHSAYLRPPSPVATANRPRPRRRRAVDVRDVAARLGPALVEDRGQVGGALGSSSGPSPAAAAHCPLPCLRSGSCRRRSVAVAVIVG